MSDASSTDTAQHVTYGHRRRPYAVEALFKVGDDGVVLENGGRKGEFLFSEITMIRLMYKPKNSTHEGYQTKIYRRDKKTAAFTNLTWNSLVDVQRQDATYSAFVRRMVTAATAANPSIVLVAGLPRWLHIIATVAGGASVVALVGVTLQAIRQGSWPVALLTTALAGYFVWWAMRFASRNRTRSFTPGTIPADVMPPQS